MKKTIKNKKLPLLCSPADIALKKIQKMKPSIASREWLMDFGNVGVTVRVSDN